MRRAEETGRGDDHPTSPVDSGAADLALHWRDRLAAGAYEFLDFGCSKGGSSTFALKLGLKSGLGLDPDPKRVATARAAGVEAVTADVIGMDLAHGAVSVVIANNFLNRLSGPDQARQAIVAALHAARDYVLIRQPFFDANPQLLALGLELQSAGRSGYPNLMTSDHLWRAARAQVEAGKADVYILGRKRIADSGHLAIAPLNMSGGAKGQERLGVKPTPPIAFDFPLFSEMVAILVKRGKSGPRADWEAISKALGCDRLLVRIGAGASPADLFTTNRAPKKTSRRDERDVAAANGRGDGARRYLFVCGVPRSGTTVLTEVLNAHPRISIGVERYKNISNRDGEDFGPQLFEQHRFFDFKETDTNVAMPKVYKMLREKYERSIYVGDKVPRYYRKIGKILDLFDPVKIVFIARDIRSVSFSWNERADNPEDHSWPAKNDFTAAVAEWNAGNRIALAAAQKSPERFAVVNYDAIVTQGLPPMERLMAWLGLEVDGEFRQAYGRIMARGPSKKEKVPKPGQDAFIAEHADEQTYQALRALAL